MADQRLRLALRAWQLEGTRKTWEAYLRESLRAGEPVFTQQGLMVALVEGAIDDFILTDDGFVAKVSWAENPRVEESFRFHAGFGDYEYEYAPIWDWWAGSIKLGWGGDWFEALGPVIEIEVEAYGFDPHPNLSFSDHTRTEQNTSNFIAERFYESDYVTNQAELVAALDDPIGWGS